MGPPQQPGDDPQSVELKLGEQFSPLALGGQGKVEAPLSLLAMELLQPSTNYDDFAGVDVKGKVVIILRKEPQQDDPQSVFNGRQSSRYALFSAKVSNAYEHGAAAVLFVNDAVQLKQAAATAKRRWYDALDRLNTLREKFQDAGRTEQEQFAEHRAEVLKATEELHSIDEHLRGDFDELLPLEGAGAESSHRKMPVFFVKRSGGEQHPAAVAWNGLGCSGKENRRGPGSLQPTTRTAGPCAASRMLCIGRLRLEMSLPCWKALERWPTKR